MKKIYVIMFFLLLLSLWGCAKEREKIPGYTPSGQRKIVNRGTSIAPEEITHTMKNIEESLETDVLLKDQVEYSMKYDGDELLEINITTKDDALTFKYKDYEYKEILIKKTNPREIYAKVSMIYNKNNFIKENIEIDFKDTLISLLFSHIRGEGRKFEAYNPSINEWIKKNLEKENKDNFTNKGAFVDNTHVDFTNNITDTQIQLDIELKRNVK